MPKKLTRKLHLIGLFAVVTLLEFLGFFWIPFWTTWTRFWCAVRMWRFLNYRWSAAWRCAARRTESWR